jgi:hypothetical protein
MLTARQIVSCMRTFEAATSRDKWAVSPTRLRGISRLGAAKAR